MNEERTMETQSLYLTGVSNARTLAGYRTQDGRAIRPHKLLRTCILVKTTPQDMDILVNQEHLGMIIDLRTETEVKAGKDPIMDGVSWYNIHVSDEQLDKGVNDAMTRMYEGDPINALIEMVRQGIMNEDTYIRFVQSEVSQKGFAQFFRQLLALPEDKSVPMALYRRKRQSRNSSRCDCGCDWRMDEKDDSVSQRGIWICCPLY